MLAGAGFLTNQQYHYVSGDQNVQIRKIWMNTVDILALLEYFCKLDLINRKKKMVGPVQSSQNSGEARSLHQSRRDRGQLVVWQVHISDCFP